MPHDQGNALPQELLDHATRPQFVYTHHWRDSDLVTWKRCLLHRALGSCQMTMHRRVLYRTVVTGSAPF